MGNIPRKHIKHMNGSAPSMPAADDTCAAQDAGQAARMLDLRCNRKRFCDCNAPYVPAGNVLKQAVANNPEKSDRAIAAEIGVNSETVRRARKKSTAASAAVGKRTAGTARPGG